jgi:hypothetical protein
MPEDTSPLHYGALPAGAIVRTVQGQRQHTLRCQAELQRRAPGVGGVSAMGWCEMHDGFAYGLGRIVVDRLVCQSNRPADDTCMDC